MTQVSPGFGTEFSSAYNNPMGPYNNPMGPYNNNPMGPYNNPMGPYNNNPMGPYNNNPMGPYNNNPMGLSLAQPAPGGNMGMAMPVMSPAQQQQMQQIAMNAMQSITPEMMCRMSEFPIKVKCPHCQMDITTVVERGAGPNSYANAFLFTCFCICFLIPCFWDNWKDDVHKCASCKEVIGRHPALYRRSRHRR
ncbi:uncharacterized protein LOC143287404 [Babylonia areolata]|uniref:uncharacterized protein LOC143287404 n=1 Tax=Babylonia areolata TaxID=304850 RepID=UPI003FD47DAB